MMLKHELALLDAQLEAEARELEIDLRPRTGIDPEVIAAWEKENGCVLTQETVEIYRWRNGLPTLLDCAFVRFHTFVRFRIAIEGFRPSYLRREYQRHGIVEHDEIVCFLRPFLHFEDDEASPDGHIYIPCTRTRVERLPLLQEHSVSLVSPPSFFADSWQALVRYARMKNERRYNLAGADPWEVQRAWEELNPMCATWNQDAW